MKRRTFVAGISSFPIAIGSQTSLIGVAAEPSTPAATPADASSAMFSVRIMTFNVWIGGEQVDFDKLVEAIQAASADVVGVQEVEGNLPRLAAELGWRYFNTRLQIISRFPIIDPPGAEGNYLFIKPLAGRIFAITNVHLPSDPYGVYAVRDGISMDELLTLEVETRMPMLEAKLDATAGLLNLDIPTFMTGDFNVPSHLDWPYASDVNLGVARIPFAWPVTKAAEDAGFHDSYRVVHPDPEVKIGYTWTAGYPSPLLRDDEILDRIDYVLFSDGIEVTTSEIVGEADGLDVDIPHYSLPVGPSGGCFVIHRFARRATDSGSG